MQVTLDSLNRRVRAGLLKVQSDGKDLLIYSYTDKCQFERKWDRHTLMARSLIVDTSGAVVCKTFEKFFNLDETPTTKLENLPEESYEITSKLDGSLCQLFYYNDEWRLSTRGSFNNEYTQFARKHLPDLTSLPINRVYACEVCLPPEADGLRRAVTHDPGVYFLAAFDAYNNFKELNRANEVKIWEAAGGKSATYFPSTKINDLIRSEETGTEGWVIRFNSGLRAKIKTLWYMKVWRIIQDLNEPHIKELMAAYPENDNAWMISFPEELLPEAKEIVTGIRNRLRWAVEEIEAIYEREVENITCKKDYAMKVKDHKYAWALFKRYDNKDYKTKLLEII